MHNLRDGDSLRALCVCSVASTVVILGISSSTLRFLTLMTYEFPSFRVRSLHVLY